MSGIIAYVLSAADPCVGRQCLAAVGSVAGRCAALPPRLLVRGLRLRGQRDRDGLRLPCAAEPAGAAGTCTGRKDLLPLAAFFLLCSSVVSLFSGHAARGSELGGGGPARARGWTGWTLGSLPAQTSLCFCSLPLSFVRLVKAVHQWGCFTVTLHSISSTYSYDFFSKQLISRNQ